ncbi:MAG: type II toxin-antitoxin system HipA family toxin [Gammaproteobacteria bacterium]|nr:type II toxin-antitoxin system HipA family toxin [Gammaproteobacteria bacterium]
MQHNKEAYVWMWLPTALEPTVIGKMILAEGKYHFTYGKSYLTRADAMALSPVELPLSTQTFSPTGLHEMPACLRDASPDAWGRRLIDYQFPQLNPNELDYLLLSGSDRIGALDFQHSATEYVARDAEPIHLEAVEELAEMLETHQPPNPKLISILMHGTSIGGARPKCLIEINDKAYIAKFSLSSDQHTFVQNEYVAMRLAAKMGITVAPVLLKSIHGRDILLVERFDRMIQKDGTYRKHMLSALSLLGLHEMEARYARYIDFADLIRQYSSDPKASLQELFSRLVFNVLIGNTDDHARNHAVFWDGYHLTLTPAYDLSPQLRVGHEATQAMMIGGESGNFATLKNAFSIHPHFLLSENDARDIIQQQLSTLDTHWTSICDEAGMTIFERSRLWGSTVKSEYCMQDWTN